MDPTDTTTMSTSLREAKIRIRSFRKSEISNNLAVIAVRRIVSLDKWCKRYKTIEVFNKLFVRPLKLLYTAGL